MCSWLNPHANVKLAECLVTFMSLDCCRVRFVIKLPSGVVQKLVQRDFLTCTVFQYYSSIDFLHIFNIPWIGLLYLMLQSETGEGKTQSGAEQGPIYYSLLFQQPIGSLSFHLFMPVITF